MDNEGSEYGKMGRQKEKEGRERWRGGVGK